MTVNKENVRKWVDALRSGEFKQGSSYLNLEETYCCLGVACEVAIREGVQVERTICDCNVEGCCRSTRYDGGDAWLPKSVQKWLGVDNGDIPIFYEDELLSAADLNDNRALSFEQIADAIEATYLKEELLTERVPAMAE